MATFKPTQALASFAAALVATWALWDQVTGKGPGSGPRLAMADAVVVDGFGLFFTVAICAAVVITKIFFGGTSGRTRSTACCRKERLPSSVKEARDLDHLISHAFEGCTPVHSWLEYNRSADNPPGAENQSGPSSSQNILKGAPDGHTYAEIRGDLDR